MLNACEFCYNGQEAIDIASNLISTALDSAGENKSSIMPISLMMLDFQMPRKNGIQVVEQIRAHINNLNLASETKVLMPLFVFVTAFSNKHFKQHISKLKVDTVYDKPLQVE